MQTHLVTRHPVFNEELNTVGYELNFSDIEVEQKDEEKMADLLPNLVGDKLMFVYYAHLNAEALLSNIDDKTNALVILTKADIDANPDVKGLVAKLKGDGYAGIAVKYDKGLANLDLSDFDYAFVDILDYEENELKETVDKLKGNSLNVIAQKVCSHAALKMVQDQGFTFTQGSFLTCPDHINQKEESNNGVLLFALLKELQDPDVSLERVEQALVQDPRLVYKLLKVVNSAAFGLKRQIESIREAIVFIGLRQIRRWAVLLSLSNIEGKPSELMRTALVRGHMCEAIGENNGMEDTARLFTLGLLSTLDALFDQDMETLLEKIALADEIKNALIKYEGQLGTLINDVIDYENANWDTLEQRKSDLSLLMESYMWAVSQTEENQAFED